MTIHSPWKLFKLAVLSFPMLVGATAHAKYPERPVTIVVSATPGAGNDILARLIASKLSDRLKQSFIVENKPGAGGMLGAAYVAKAKPDGYTLMVHSPALAISKAVLKDPGFDVEKDFAPIGMLALAPMSIVTNVDIPVKTLSEFIAFAKKNPGKMNFGSAGNGSLMHVVAELFVMKAGINNMVHVQYQGGAPSVAALMRNEIQMLAIDVDSITAGVQAGKLKVLAVGTPERVKSLPDVPTTVEAGMPFEAVAWYGFFAPAGIPADVLTELDQQTAEVVSDPAYRADMAKRGWQTPLINARAMKARISAEVATWREVAKAANINPQ